MPKQGHAIYKGDGGAGKGEGSGGLGHGIRKGVGMVTKLGKQAGSHGIRKGS